jgi:hypothetical protein
MKVEGGDRCTRSRLFPLDYFRSAVEGGIYQEFVGDGHWHRVCQSDAGDRFELLLSCSGVECN